MSTFKGSSVKTWYVNGGAGVGGDTPADNTTSNRGEAPDNAWDTIQFAFDKVADGTVDHGDEIRIMNTGNYTIGTTLAPDWDSKEVLIIGANAEGEVDGTQAVLIGNVGGSSPMLNLASTKGERSMWANLHFDANDNSEHCVESTSNNHYIHWVNCRFSQATSHGVNRTGANYWSFVKCRFDNNAHNGLQNTSTSFGVSYDCLFDNNGQDGADSGWRESWIRSVFYNNGTEGLVFNSSGGRVIDCVFDSNGSDGMIDEGTTNQGLRVNNIFSNNSAYGVDNGNNTDIVSFNELFYNNGSGDFDTAQGQLAEYFNYTPGASGYNPNYLDVANFDFTTGATFEGHGTGMPSPIRKFGSTANDPGILKWTKTESVSIF